MPPSTAQQAVFLAISILGGAISIWAYGAKGRMSYKNISIGFFLMSICFFATFVVRYCAFHPRSLPHVALLFGQIGLLVAATLLLVKGIRSRLSGG